MLKVSKPELAVQPKGTNAERREAWEKVKQWPHQTRFTKGRRKSAEKEAARLTELTGCQWHVAEIMWVNFG